MDETSPTGESKYLLVNILSLGSAKKIMTLVAKLKKGQSFGDMALLDYKPRSATIKCVTDCKFAVVPKIQYQKIFGKIQKKILNRLLDMLQEIPYFEEWTRNDVKKLSYCFKEVDYKRNNTI